MVPIEPTCSSEGRMAGEGNLFGGEEDADLHTTLALDLGSARKDEGRLVEIRFAGEGLHLVGGKAAGIGKDSEGVAFKRGFGKDIDLREVVRAVGRCGSCG